MAQRSPPNSAPRRPARRAALAAGLLALTALAVRAGVDPAAPAPAPADAPAPAPAPQPRFDEIGHPAPPAAADLPEIVVEAPEPRYVAPTRRDHIGRIWAPVMIDGHGPYRMVLDTGATSSAVNATTAHELGRPLIDSTQFMLEGVTGERAVQAVAVERLEFGELEVHPRRLPIISDALGGAEGVLGAEGLADKRILIDFRHDQISIKRSHMERAEAGMVTVPFRIVRGILTVVDARIGDIPVRAIIDTGGQVSIGNSALRRELLRAYRTGLGHSEQITGTTLDVQNGNRVDAPPIVLGGLTLSQVRVTISDLYIFKYWHLADQPTMLVGMDLLGLLDTLVIDYKRRELQIRLRR